LVTEFLRGRDLESELLQVKISARACGDDARLLFAVVASLSPKGVMNRRLPLRSMPTTQFRNNRETRSGRRQSNRPKERARAAWGGLITSQNSRRNFDGVE